MKKITLRQKITKNSKKLFTSRLEHVTHFRPHIRTTGRKNVQSASKSALYSYKMRYLARIGSHAFLQSVTTKSVRK